MSQNIRGLGTEPSPAWYAEARRLKNLAFAVQMLSSLREDWHDWMTDRLVEIYPEIDSFVLAALVYLAYVRRPIPQIKALRMLSALAEESKASWVGEGEDWERHDSFESANFFPPLRKGSSEGPCLYRVARAADAIQLLALSGAVLRRSKGEGEEVLEAITFPLKHGEMQFSSTVTWEVPELEESSEE